MKFKICQEIGTSWKAKRMDGFPVSVFMQVILVIMTGASLSSSLYFILIWLVDPECFLCNLVIVILDSIGSKGWAKNAKYAIVSSLYFPFFVYNICNISPCENLLVRKDLRPRGVLVNEQLSV